MDKPTIFLGADHGGFALKEALKQSLTGEGYRVTDLGPAADDPADDYPDYGFPVAERVANTPGSRGILLCKGGQGMAIAANKVPGIRAAVLWDTETARLAREHNDTNVLSLPADRLSVAEAQAIVTTWLTTPFSGDERHVRRIGKITAYEQRG